MATVKLLVTGETYNCPIGKGISFSYDPNRSDGCLEVYRDGSLIHEKTGVQVGSAFTIEITKDRTTLMKATPPHRKEDLLLWILSFKKADRIYDPAKAERFLEKRCEIKNCPVYARECITGEGYAFILRDQIRSNGEKHIAAFIDPEKLDKALVKKILQRWTYRINWTRELVEKLLRARFGFNDADIAEVAYVSYYSHKTLALESSK